MAIENCQFIVGLPTKSGDVSIISHVNYQRIDIYIYDIKTNMIIEMYIISVSMYLK